MPKGIRKIELGEDQIQRLFLDLAKLEPPKKPTVKEVLEKYKAQIEIATKRGNSLRDISKFLSDGGVRVSHETLRKLAEEWGFTKSKTATKKPAQESTKHSRDNIASKPVEPAQNTPKQALKIDTQNSQEPSSNGRFTPRKDSADL